MIGPDPRPAPGLARWAESYEAKSERRQETRESRRCRPNVTTCRLAGKAPRTQQREQLRRARQQQFFRRRNLEVEEKGEAKSPPAREPGPSRIGQATDLKEPLSWANRISSPRQQVGHVEGHTALEWVGCGSKAAAALLPWVGSRSLKADLNEAPPSSVIIGSPLASYLF